VTGLQTMLLGIPWMDPNWLLDHFHTQFVLVSLVIVFIECGLLFPFLPGDTLLVSVGLFLISPKPQGSGYQLELASSPFLGLLLAIVVFTAAAFLGNVAGYELGRAIGHPVRRHDGRVVKKAYIDRTVEFFEHHGSQALVIGRFVPFVRTYVTLVAGVSEMNRVKFWLWSVVGAGLWVVSITCIGYFLGKTFPTITRNIDLLILALLALSVIPVVYEWWKHRRQEATS
jgi:membrane-associated protein